MTIYLDHNATTPLRPGVAEAMAEALTVGGNPSSVHAVGRRARRMVEDAREQVANLVDAQPEDVVFTSGGTEANALALMGLSPHAAIVSAIEHDAVMTARPDAARLPVDRHGQVRAAILPEMMATASSDDSPPIVSVMAANNETGVVQPMADVSTAVRGANALLHSDAVQAVGKAEGGKLDGERAIVWDGIDLLSLSAHKIGGPAGVGALIVRRRAAALWAARRGGGQERGRRGGTENVSGIVGFGEAARLAGLDTGWIGRVRALRDTMERCLTADWPMVSVAGADAPRLATTSCLMVPGAANETMVMALDLAGVAVSAGAACSSGKARPSHVLEAMGFGPEAAGSAIRVSLGWNSTAADVDAFLAAFGRVLSRRLEGWSAMAETGEAA